MAKTGDGDFLRSVADSVLQIITEADVEGLIGAGRHERSGKPSTGRNGNRDPSLDNQPTRAAFLSAVFSTASLASTSAINSAVGTTRTETAMAHPRLTRSR